MSSASVYHSVLTVDNYFLPSHAQLRKEFGSRMLPPFPPKKLLSLAAHEVEERRSKLEHFIQLGNDNNNNGWFLYSANFLSRKLNVLAHTIHKNIHTDINIIYTHTRTHAHIYISL